MPATTATPLAVGLAIGVYGLTQGLFQVPFGFLSDRIGRKTVIIGGLAIFGAGSLVAAGADSIAEVIAGRALQGLGAIAAAVMALAADLTREEVRIRIMAMIGMSIGASFMLAMIAGPILAAAYGLPSLFWLAAGLSLLGILVVFHRDAPLSIADIGRVAADRELQKLAFGVFILHLMLAATFVAFPLKLQHELGIAGGDHWRTYLPVFVLSIGLLLPMVIVAEKYRRLRAVFASAVLMLVLAQLGLAFSDDYVLIFALLVLFFGAFNFLEAVMPAHVSRIAPAAMKGTAMGLFSTAQFLGAFAGGVLGGLLLGFGERDAVFVWVAAILGLWLLVALTMKAPRYLSSVVVSLRDVDPERLDDFVERAGELPGVCEIAVDARERVAYLKVEKKFDLSRLQALT